MLKESLIIKTGRIVALDPTCGKQHAFQIITQELEGKTEDWNMTLAAVDEVRRKLSFYSHHNITISFPPQRII